MHIVLLFGFIFKENRVFIEEKYNLSEKVIIADEEPDCVDIDGTGSVEDLPRLALIDQEYENRNAVADGEDLTGNINKRKKPAVLQSYRCQFCEKC